MPNCLRSELTALQIRRGDFLIHADGCGAREFVMQSDIEMAATNALADDLADARLKRLEAFGNAQMQIEKAMIDAANGDAQAPAIFDGARLRVARHRFQARGLRRRLRRDSRRADCDRC